MHTLVLRLTCFNCMYNSKPASTQTWVIGTKAAPLSGCCMHILYIGNFSSLKPAPLHLYQNNASCRPPTCSPAQGCCQVAPASTCTVATGPWGRGLCLLHKLCLAQMRAPSAAMAGQHQKNNTAGVTTSQAGCCYCTARSACRRHREKSALRVQRGSQERGDCGSTAKSASALQQGSYTGQAHSPSRPAAKSNLLHAPGKGMQSHAIQNCSRPGTATNNSCAWPRMVNVNITQHDKSLCWQVYKVWPRIRDAES